MTHSLVRHLSNGLEHTRESGYRDLLGQLLAWTYSEGTYLEAFPDVCNVLFSKDLSSGLHHFLQSGRDEIADGRRAIPTSWQLPKASWLNGGQPCRVDFGYDIKHFNQQLYAAFFPDTKTYQVLADEMPGFRHWLDCGFAECKRGSRTLHWTPAAVSSVYPGKCVGYLTPGANFRDQRYATGPITIIGEFHKLSRGGLVARELLFLFQKISVGVVAVPLHYDGTKMWVLSNGEALNSSGYVVVGSSDFVSAATKLYADRLAVAQCSLAVITSADIIEGAYPFGLYDEVWDQRPERWKSNHADVVSCQTSNLIIPVLVSQPHSNLPSYIRVTNHSRLIVCPQVGTDDVGSGALASLLVWFSSLASKSETLLIVPRNVAAAKLVMKFIEARYPSILENVVTLDAELDESDLSLVIANAAVTIALSPEADLSFAGINQFGTPSTFISDDDGLQKCKLDIDCDRDVDLGSNGLVSNKWSQDVIDAGRDRMLDVLTLWMSGLDQEPSIRVDVV